MPNILHIMRTSQLRLVGMQTKLSPRPFEPWKLFGLLCFPVDLSLDSRGMPHTCTGQHSARDLKASLSRSPGLVWVSFLLPSTLPHKVQSPPSPQILSSIKTAGLFILLSALDMETGLRQFHNAHPTSLLSVLLVVPYLKMVTPFHPFC